MKIVIFLFSILAAFVNNAAPNFVTPTMIYRNGLTDEQYELLWKQGKNPKITIDAARDWIFRSSRYGNVTNWLEIIGKTNNFAKLVVPTMATNDWLVATNKGLKASVGKLERDIYYMEPFAERALKIERAAQKAAQKDSKKYAKWIDDTEKAMRKAETAEMKMFYFEIISIATNAVPVPPNK